MWSTQADPVKTAAGDSDLQARGLAFKDYTFLKDGEDQNNLRTLLWQTARRTLRALSPIPN